MLGLKPTQSRLRGFIDVSEESHRWLKGRVVGFGWVVELSWEDLEKLPHFPKTYLTYVGLWFRKKTLLEYQLGLLITYPDQDVVDHFVVPLIERLEGYVPINLMFT